MRRMLIAVSSEDMQAALTSAFRKEFETTACGDGETALELLAAFKPYALILDLMLPKMEGLTVLEEAGDHLPPVILCISRQVTDYTVQAAMDLGAGYIIRTPCTLRAITNRVRDMVQRNDFPRPSPKNPQSLATSHLHRLGVSSDPSGYRYLRIGIPLFAQDPHQSLSKELYSAIVTLCGCTSTDAVEIAIRKTICSAWKKRDDAVWAAYFPPESDGQILRPPNKMFIARLAEKLNEEE